MTENIMPGTVHPLPLYIRSLMSAERCVVCHDGATGGLDIICPECAGKLEKESSWVCPRCGAFIRDCVCMTREMKMAGVSAFVKLYPYMSDASSVSGRILYRLKLKKDRMLTMRECDALSSGLLSVLSALDENPGDCLVTYIPRSRKRVMESGTDQGRELSRAMARIIGAESAALITRVPGAVIQKTLDAQARLLNAGEAFDIKNAGKARGRCIIIIDDLVTSGATMSGCAALLVKAGAHCVVCASLAHTVGPTAPYFDPEKILI